MFAEVGQSTNRGTANVDGMTGAFACSARLWSFKEHRMILPEELMGMHGLCDYDFAGLSQGQCHALVGNSMSATTLAVALIPVLAALDQFVQK